MKSSELGCVQANVLLPLCEEYIKERTDSLQRQKDEEQHINELLEYLNESTNK